MQRWFCQARRLTDIRKTRLKSSAELDNKTSFGFEKVTEDEKLERVNKVFCNVASRYDLMNDIMSVGIHRFWKNHFVRTLGVPSGSSNFRFLDVAGGTGDIASRIVERFGCSSNVTMLDINMEMLKFGQSRKPSKLHEVNLVNGNAENLPFADNQFDIYTIAFGIRNCVHIDKVLAEAFRVLRRGGRFCCLEFSKMQGIYPLGLVRWKLANIQKHNILGLKMD